MNEERSKERDDKRGEVKGEKTLEEGRKEDTLQEIQTRT